MTNIVLKVPTGRTGQVQTEYGNATIANGLVTVDSRAAPALLGAGFIPQDDDLPTGESLFGGSHTATADEATANEIDIDTGLSVVTSYLVQIFRAGVMVLGDAVVSEAGGVINIADGASTYVVTAGDVVKWVALGTI